MVLTNLLLYRAVVDSGSMWFWSGTRPVDLLINAFLSAQLSAAIVWLILATIPFETKSLLTAAACTPPVVTLIVLMSTVTHGRAEFLIAITFVQLAATAGLAALLCALGWRIVHLDSCREPAQGAWLQFSIRNILIATTAVAIFSAFGKAVMTHPAHSKHWLELFQIVIEGALLTALSLVAVWAALGAGRSLSRMSLLWFFALAFAGLLWWGDAAAKAIYYLPGGEPVTSTAWRLQQSLAGRWWAGWTLLAGTFMSSWLSVLRVTGYRLVRCW
jgi:hypothetical protein